MNKTFRYFVGIDWGTQMHRVVLLDSNGLAIEEYNAEHSGEGLSVLVERLKRRTSCDPMEVAVGIEVGWGALVETLVESGFTLLSINSKQLDRFRDRFTVAGAKDDSRDALVLAKFFEACQQEFRSIFLVGSRWIDPDCLGQGRMLWRAADKALGVLLVSNIENRLPLRDEFGCLAIVHGGGRQQV